MPSIIGIIAFVLAMTYGGFSSLKDKATSTYASVSSYMPKDLDDADGVDTDALETSGLDVDAI